MRISDWSSDVCSSDLIALQVVAVAMFTCMGMIIKLLDGRYPTSQIILFRCAPALLPLLLYLPMQGGWSALKTRRPGWHLIRTVAGLGSMYVGRSEEHTSELQSLMRISYAVFCLKKKKQKKIITTKR